MQIDDDFSLINEDENELFEKGFMKTLEDKITGKNITGGASNYEKNIIKSISDEDIYLSISIYILLSLAYRIYIR